MLLGLRQFYNDVAALLADSLFPMYCFGCAAEGSFLCDRCAKALTPAEQQCLMCHKPAFLGETHPRCFKSRGTDTIYSVFDYHDPLVADLLIFGKYKFLPSVYEIFGRLMSAHLKAYPHLFEDAALVPIPLSKSRLRWRGFNQSLIICEQLSVQLNIPVRDMLRRTKNTKTQKDLGVSERVLNMEDAFGLNLDDSLDATSSIILVDDVVTTGSTLLSAVRVLKQHGAKKVICITIARD